MNECVKQNLRWQGLEGVLSSIFVSLMILFHLSEIYIHISIGYLFCSIKVLVNGKGCRC